MVCGVLRNNVKTFTSVVWVKTKCSWWCDPSPLPSLGFLVPFNSRPKLLRGVSSNFTSSQTEMASCFSCDLTRVVHVSVMSVFSLIAALSVILRLVAQDSEDEDWAEWLSLHSGTGRVINFWWVLKYIKQFAGLRISFDWLYDVPSVPALLEIIQETHFHVDIIPLGLGSTGISVDYRFLEDQYEVCNKDPYSNLQLMTLF